MCNTKWRITQTKSGITLGDYVGHTENDAIRNMLIDAGAPTAEPDSGLYAVELVLCCGEYVPHVECCSKCWG